MMTNNSLTGYLWIFLGIFLVMLFGGRLLFQLLAITLGLTLIFKGLRLLALDRAVYHYSKNYFDEQFKR